MATALVVSSLLISACSPTLATHGHSLDDAALEQIEPGRTSKQQVLQLLGSPSSLSTFDDSAWYYVSQRTEKVSFYQEDVVEQDVVSVTFGDNDTVEAVDRHGLEQTAAIDPVDRITPTAGAELSIFEQFVSNIGRFGGAGSSDPDS
ncbi:MAG: outer membrane protein assembly factor BamE [Geminicoccaceae bacterium]